MVLSSMPNGKLSDIDIGRTTIVYALNIDIKKTISKMSSLPIKSAFSSISTIPRGLIRIVYKDTNPIDLQCIFKKGRKVNDCFGF